MTTILSDYRFGIMVADSNVSDEDRVWAGKKVFRIKGALIGMSGAGAESKAFLDWYRSGFVGSVKFGGSSALILCKVGLFHYDSNYVKPVRVPSGREAIGTGGKAAMCAYEALWFTDPRRAVSIVCKHDASSRAPVRVYRL